MSFYPDLRATAERLLIGKGQRISLRKQTAGAYNPATGSTGITSSTYTGIPAAVVGYKNAEIDGTLILKGDKKVLLGADSLSVVPEKDDVLSIGGVDHSIKDVEHVAPGGVDVIYKIQARRT